MLFFRPTVGKSSVYKKINFTQKEEVFSRFRPKKEEGASILFAVWRGVLLRRDIMLRLLLSCISRRFTNLHIRKILLFKFFFTKSLRPTEKTCFSARFIFLKYSPTMTLSVFGVLFFIKNIETAFKQSMFRYCGFFNCFFEKTTIFWGWVIFCQKRFKFSGFNRQILDFKCVKIMLK